MNQPHLNLQRGLRHKGAARGTARDTTPDAARHHSKMPTPEDVEQQVGEQETWKGGGREPAHPDDVGDEGEYSSTENRRRRDGAGSSDS